MRELFFFSPKISNRISKLKFSISEYPEHPDVANMIVEMCPNMCYCDCGDNLATAKCEPTHHGWKWNDGIKLANGSYALNGTRGDDKEYKCT